MLNLTTVIATELSLALGYQNKKVSGEAFWAEVDRLATFGEQWEEQEILL